LIAPTRSVGSIAGVCSLGLLGAVGDGDGVAVGLTADGGPLGVLDTAPVDLLGTA